MFSLWKGSISLQVTTPSCCSWISGGRFFSYDKQWFQAALYDLSHHLLGDTGSTVTSSLFESMCWNSKGDAWCSQPTFCRWACRTSVSPWTAYSGIEILWLSLKVLLHLTVSRALPIHKPQIRNLKHRLRRTRHVKCSRLVAEDAFDLSEKVQRAGSGIS